MDRIPSSPGCRPVAGLAARFASRLRLVAAATLLALGGGLACTTPSVPLPPPLLTSLSFQPGTSAPGTIVMQGEPTPRHANVRFYTFNRTQRAGVITDTSADGSFTTSPFAAVAGDDIQLYFDDANGESSQTLCTTVIFNAPLLSSDCR